MSGVSVPGGGEENLRPLRRVNAGCWRSRDGRWTFMRHHSDPHPQRWFAYEGDDSYPANDGLGHTTLTEVVELAAREDPA